MVVGIDGRSCVGRFERLLEQTDFASHARDEPVEDLHVVNGFFDDLLVGGGAIEAALSVSVVVAKGQQFFMALLQRLESCQAFVDRDLSHASAFIPIQIALDDDDAIVAEGLSMVLGQSADSRSNLTFFGRRWHRRHFLGTTRSQVEERKCRMHRVKRKGGAE